MKFSVKSMNKDLGKEAKKYADKLKAEGSLVYGNDHDGFLAGAKWALENNVGFDIKKLSDDLIILKNLHSKIFVSNIPFSEEEAELYERLVSKYEDYGFLEIFKT